MKLSLEKSLILDTDYELPKLFIVVGCGGTGSYFIPNLIRQVSIMNNKRLLDPNMNLRGKHLVVLIDGDQVSESNLTRQNFIQSDLGQNKAEVLARRYGAAFNQKVHYHPEYLSEDDQFLQLVRNTMTTFYGHSISTDLIPVIVDCVDNNKTRTILEYGYLELLNDVHRAFFLSSGNEDLSGQVVCGHLLSKRFSSSRIRFDLPSALDLFPEIRKGEDKLPTELSCDEAAVSNPQNIMTNITAATHLFQFANVIMASKLGGEDIKGLTHFAVTYNTENGTQRTFPIKESILNKHIIRTGS